MAKYLYGASVQGIQGFIFQTNELKDIVGASELVNSICAEEFEEYGGPVANSIIRAAGNIKHVFNQEEDCKKAVREFPRKVMELAPGITISQAVVKYENDQEFGRAVDKLEQDLKTQRNKQTISNMGFIGMRRSRTTGLPVVEVFGKDYLDLSTLAKRKIASSKSINSTKKLCDVGFGIEVPHSRIAYDIENITKHNDWIAIIHADGNGLGRVVQKIGREEEEFSAFSKNLNDATIKSAQEAFGVVREKFDFEQERHIPIRPIILGGDDLTIICRADFAIDYTKEFLKAFEENTAKLLGDILKKNKVFKSNETKLTACAGITFIKSSFPFYFGYDLAEELCKAAKKVAKKDLNDDELPKSCLMFHKVQDSFVEDYDEITKRELNISTDKSFRYGPYFLDGDDNFSIETLLNKCSQLNTKEGNAVKSHLRQWISLQFDNPDAAKQKIGRLKAMLKLSETKESRGLIQLVEWVEKGKKRNDCTIYPAYDLLSLHSITFQKTKKNKKGE